VGADIVCRSPSGIVGDSDNHFSLDSEFDFISCIKMNRRRKISLLILARSLEAVVWGASQPRLMFNSFSLSGEFGRE
jgi:hypothetical protein